MEEKKVITLLCERAADLNNLLDSDGKLQGVSGMSVVKLPCSGMIQPLMIEGALKAGAAGVLVCGCQIGDCFYREGNKMIRERLLGGRPPGLKKATDRRRVRALWLSRVQVNKFISDANEFVAYVHGLEAPAPEAAKPAPAAKPAAPAADKPAASDKPVAADKPAAAKSDAAEKPAQKKAEAKAEGKKEDKPEKSKETAEDKPATDTASGDATASGDK
jgi:coenzyme F420-reducing hydrogenase delta subunit